MDTALHSPLWHRIRAATPRLVRHVEVRRQRVRGDAWAMIYDPASGRAWRVNDLAWHVLGRCDGARTVESIWRALLDVLGDDAPTQPEMIDLLARLAQEQLLVTPGLENLPKRGKAQRRASFVNPFAFRVPLGDPGRQLEKVRVGGRVIFSRAGLYAWALLVIGGGLAALVNHETLVAGVHAGVHSPRQWLLAWLTIPLLKSAHELAHALAVHRWGGQVRQAGVTVFLLTPAPWVDASAATLFPRRARVIVGAAGIMAELAIAALAVFLFLALPHGLIQEAALAVIVMGTLSTLAFNGNPLVPFDAYHVLCDALELPNLATRSRQWWVEWLGGRMGARAPGATLAIAKGEAKWLLAYAPLAFAYRVSASVLVVAWIASYSLAAALGAALLLSLGGVVRPITLFVKAALQGASSARAGLLAAVTAGSVFIFGFVVPLPAATRAVGVVALPETAHVRAATEGFVRALPVPDGERVESGERLAALEDPVLVAERTRLIAERERLEGERFRSLLTDRVALADANAALLRNREALSRIEQRLASLMVSSQVAGRLVMPRQSDLEQTFVREGALLGYVLDPSDLVVRVAVAEADAPALVSRTRRISVRLASDVATIHEALQLRELPAASRTLPAAVLGDRYGGEHLTEPGDTSGMATIDPVVVVELRLPAGIEPRVGERAWVRFDHAAEPLAPRAGRALRRLLLRHFDSARA